MLDMILTFSPLSNYGMEKDKSGYCIVFSSDQLKANSFHQVLTQIKQCIFVQMPQRSQMLEFLFEPVWASLSSGFIICSPLIYFT